MKARPGRVAVAWPLCGLLALVGTEVHAQGLGASGGQAYSSPGGAAQSAGRSAGSQEGGTPERSFWITPGLRGTVELTDNVNLSATDKQSDLILGVAPSIQIGGQSGRVKGYLSYALNANVHASGESTNNLQNVLRASGSAELVPSQVYVDAFASISQQYIDPFGLQSPDPGLNNPNRTEVSTVSVSPYARGQIAGQVSYLARAFYSFTSSGTSQAPGSQTFGALIDLNSSTRWPRLSWGLTLSYREVNFSDQRDEFDQLNILSLNYAIFPELVVSLRGNVETTNLTSLNGETHYGYGGSVRWSPSPRTNLQLVYDTRIFGSSHLYSFDYRTARTVWSISSRQGLSTGQNLGGFGGIGADAQGQQGTAFDLLFAQFATVQPDPVLRTQLVNDYLKANGIDPNTTLSTGYLPSSVTEQLSNQASVAWLLQRGTLILSAYQTKSRNLGPLSNPGNDFANGNSTDWLGFGLSWSHRLTPRYTLTAALRQQRTQQSQGNLETTLWTGNVILTGQVAYRVSGSLMFRRTVFDSATSPYTENALLATLGMTF